MNNEINNEKKKEIRSLFMKRLLIKAVGISLLFLVPCTGFLIWYMTTLRLAWLIITMPAIIMITMSICDFMISVADYYYNSRYTRIRRKYKYIEYMKEEEKNDEI